ncbi:MAG: hypothetical protein IPL83_00620 [Bdellovibrionales bacterium]|nr:hypothetical protein [Bdellovibrionales bacterium]
MKILISYLVLFFCLCSDVLAESRYDFFNERFQIGPWTPETLSLTEGLKKIKLIDDWFYSLPVPERRKVLDQYVINRNRLFIITQEKRLLADLQSISNDIIFGSASGLKQLEEELVTQLTTLQQVRRQTLDDTEALKNALVNKLDDLSDLLPADTRDNGGTNSGALFSNSFSFGSQVSKAGGSNIPRSLNRSGFEPTNIEPLNACRNDDVCVNEDMTEILEKIGIGDELFPNEQEPKGMARTLEIKETQRTRIVHQEFGACEGLEAAQNDFKEYFDPSKNPKLALFLKETGISRSLSNRTSNNLSSWYSEPTTQWPEGTGGKPSATCVGHAIASDATAAMYRANWIKHPSINTPKGVSPDHTYAAALMNEINSDMHRRYPNLRPEQINWNYPKPDPSMLGYCDPRLHDVSQYSGIQNIMDAMVTFTLVPLCSNSKVSPVSASERYQIDKFSGIDFNPGDQLPNFDVIKAMIDSGHPPIVRITSDARFESADWLTITSQGSMHHVLNIVGYDKGIDPMTLCPTKYFIVRDSLGKKKIHYKVTANNLLRYIAGIYHISKIRALGFAY